jgi:biopolymer transport protein ExbD
MNFGRKHKVHIESGMSTLSDIIFMLLIFFIIASAGAVQELSAQIDKPQAGNGKENATGLSITITKDMAYSLNGTPAEKATILNLLQEKLNASDDKRVLLRVDKMVPTGETIEIFSGIQQIGGTPFIATEKGN